jgi:hypothetical protein
MHTPYFPAFRSRLAALGRRTTHRIRQATLAQLQEHLRDFLPAPLLSAEDQGPNSRDRLFSLRLTFEGWGWGQTVEKAGAPNEIGLFLRSDPTPKPPPSAEKTSKAE